MFSGSSSCSFLGDKPPAFILTENTHACEMSRLKKTKNVPHKEEQGPRLGLGVVAGREVAIHVR